MAVFQDNSWIMATKQYATLQTSCKIWRILLLSLFLLLLRSDYGHPWWINTVYPVSPEPHHRPQHQWGNTEGHDFVKSLPWRHNGRDGVSNHQPHDCLLKRSFRRRSKKASKLRVTGLCAGNSPVTGDFPAQRASDAENISIWWRHHIIKKKPPGATVSIISEMCCITNCVLLLY